MIFPKVDLHTMNWQLGLFHPNFSMERYQEILHRPCLKSINPINMSFFSFLILFRHEGLKTENAKLISKYWCKMRSTVVINTDVKNVLKSCVQLSKCFSENIFWLNPRSSFVNVITPRYIHTSFYIYFSSHYNLYLWSWKLFVVEKSKRALGSPFSFHFLWLLATSHFSFQIAN